MGNRKKRAASWRWRSATRVVDGVVQAKNRTAGSSEVDTLVVRRESAGKGWRHVLRGEDIFRFVELYDDWHDLSRGLRTIRLASGSYRFGYWRRGTVAVCALPDHRQLAHCYLDHYARRLLDVLDVPTVTAVCDGCHKEVPHRALSEDQARAWMLLDVFQHEIGHHHDAMSNRGGFAERGEYYALEFAEARWKRLWPRYQRMFRI